MLVAGGWLAISTPGKKPLDLFQALPCGSPDVIICAKRKCLKPKFLDLLSACSHNNNTQHSTRYLLTYHLLLGKQQALLLISASPEDKPV